MKKFITLAFILITSLFCTACINNLAIQELNQIGKEYLDKGDYDNAIARFQSSVDLDENVFESRYNLGVAYIAKEEFKKAIDELKIAVQINPDSPDAYYSYAVALESYGFSVFEKKEPTADLADAIIVEEEITQDMANDGLEYANKSVKMYEKYLALSPEAKDKDIIISHINEIKENIKKYADEYKLNQDGKDTE